MFGSSRIGWKPLAGLCRRVGTSLAAGLDSRQIWQREAQRGLGRYRAQMGRISRSVQQGEAVSDAMRDTGGYFPQIVHDLVDVGERAGRLDEVFSRLADHYDHRLRMRRIFLVGILWPAIQLAATVVVVGLLIWISGWVSQRAGETVDLLGLGLMGTRGVVIYAILILSILGVGCVLGRGLVFSRLFAGPVTRLIMRTPVLGPYVRTIALERMAWTLSVAMKSGLDARQSVQMAIRSTQNVPLIEHTGDVDRMIADGREIHEALRATGAFPSEFVDTIEVGEQSGRLEEAMDHLSREYVDRARATSNGLTVVAAFATWGIVAALIISLIFRLALTYRDMIFNAAGNL